MSDLHAMAQKGEGKGKGKGEEGAGLEKGDVRVEYRQLVHLGRDHLARTAPLRVEVHQSEGLPLHLPPKLRCGGPGHHLLHHCGWCVCEGAKAGKGAMGGKKREAHVERRDAPLRKEKKMDVPRSSPQTHMQRTPLLCHFFAPTLSPMSTANVEPLLAP